MTTNPTRHIRRFSLGALSVFVVIAFSSCDATTTSSSSSSYSSTAGSSSMACTHWSNIMGDVRAGILTDAELRTKISEVRNSATTPAVSTAATHMLSAVTSRDKSAILVSFAELETACG